MEYLLIVKYARQVTEFVADGDRSIVVPHYTMTIICCGPQEMSKLDRTCRELSHATRHP